MPELDLLDFIMIGGAVALFAVHYIWSKFLKKPNDDEEDGAEPPAIMSAPTQDTEEIDPTERYH